MQGKMKKEELPVYRTPNGLGKIIHMAAWGILFGIPFFFTGREEETVTVESYMRFVIVPISFMLVFYVNYFILVPKHHPKPQMGKEPPLRNKIGFFLGNAMMYILVSGLSVAIRVTRNWYRIETMRRDLEQSRVEAELQNLKSQLNPHFLFNTLNNIYCLIAFSPDRAQGVVHDLSRLLRYVLYDSNQKFVPLGKRVQAWS